MSLSVRAGAERADRVYAHYGLASQIVVEFVPILCDARWYALLSQCERHRLANALPMHHNFRR